MCKINVYVQIIGTSLLTIYHKLVHVLQNHDHEKIGVNKKNYMYISCAVSPI